MTQWTLVEMVQWGLTLREQAERQDANFIVVKQIYTGAQRASAQVAEHACVVQVVKDYAFGAGWVVLRRLRTGAAAGSWIVDDFANVTGDRTDVNRELRALSLTLGPSVRA